VLVHAREAEEKFIAEGFGVKRYPVMYNDFIIVGPKDDPASIKGARSVAFALQTIKAKGAPFISRGDNSGTHIAEINLWKDVGIDIKKEAGPWYKSTGKGMGATLNAAAAIGAYAMSDRGAGPQLDLLRVKISALSSTRFPLRPQNPTSARD